jgi:hypothetical protein
MACGSRALRPVGRVPCHAATRFCPDPRPRCGHSPLRQGRQVTGCFSSHHCWKPVTWGTTQPWFLCFSYLGKAGSDPGHVRAGHIYPSPTQQAGLGFLMSYVRALGSTAWPKAPSCETIQNTPRGPPAKRNRTPGRVPWGRPVIPATWEARDWEGHGLS